MVTQIHKSKQPRRPHFVKEWADVRGLSQADPPRVVYDKLRDASPAMQRRAIDVLEALLKAG